ncbi:MFS transporter [Streptomyces niveus]|uniref:MFS transporter n=1 Tax=Streptomyces niveus TaxID=193462 RepID=UPI0036D37134
MVVPAILYGLVSFAIPESPRCLISVGRNEAAKAVLAEVEDKHTYLDARVREIEVNLRKEHKPTFKDLLGRVGFLPVVWIGIGLSALQQLVGINVIFYCSASLWQSVGIDPTSSFFYSFTPIINIIGTVIAMIFVDRIGRRPLLLIGSAGVTVSLALAAWAFSYKSGSGTNISIPKTQGTVALVAAHAFVLFFALSWGVVVWVLLGEMLPGRIRAAALGVAASAQWIANWAVTVTFPTLSDWDLSGAYVIYPASPCSRSSSS